MENHKFKIGLGTFDFTKGAAIILVILGHMILEYDFLSFSSTSMKTSTLFVRYVLDPMYSSINIGLMPCFFLITGYTFKPINSGRMLKKSFSNLFIPYFKTSVMSVLVYLVVNAILYGSIKGTVGWVLAFLFGLHDPWDTRKTFCGIKLQVCGIAWFLLAMFISTNIFNAITRNIKNKFCFILSVVLCAAIGILFVEAGFTYYCIPQGLIAVLYLFIGYVLNKFDFFALSPKTQFKFVLLCCAFSTIISSYYKYDISFNIYENAPIVLTGSIAGGIVLFVCGVHLGQLEWHAFDWVKTIGVYSLYILCIHSVEYDFLPWRLIRLSMPSHIGLAFAVESLFRICVITSACMEVKRITLKKHKRMRKQNGR